jgi:hypothetical protein
MCGGLWDRDGQTGMMTDEEINDEWTLDVSPHDEPNLVSSGQAHRHERGGPILMLTLTLWQRMEICLSWLGISACNEAEGEGEENQQTECRPMAKPTQKGRTE